MVITFFEERAVIIQPLFNIALLLYNGCVVASLALWIEFDVNADGKAMC